MPLTARHTAAAPPEVVWDVLVDTALWPRWGPTVSAVELDEPGTVGSRITAGSRGRVRTPVGVWLPFTVTEWVPGERWAWRVAGVPATAHAVGPAPAGEGRDVAAEVVLEVPWWAPAYLPVCIVAARRIADLAAEAQAAGGTGATGDGPAR